MMFVLAYICLLSNERKNHENWYFKDFHSSVWIKTQINLIFVLFNTQERRKSSIWEQTKLMTKNVSSENFSIEFKVFDKVERKNVHLDDIIKSIEDFGYNNEVTFKEDSGLALLVETGLICSSRLLLLVSSDWHNIYNLSISYFMSLNDAALKIWFWTLTGCDP